MENKQKTAIVVGAGDVGGGFVEALASRGDAVFVQYRNEKKLPSLKERFPFQNVKYVHSDLIDEKQILDSLKGCDTTFDVAILSAGGLLLDTEFDSIEKSKEHHYEINVATKERFISAYAATLDSSTKQPDLFIAGSHAGDWTEEQATDYGEIGYWHSMQILKGFPAMIAEKYKNMFNVHLLTIDHVEGNQEGSLLKNLRAKVGNIPIGQDPKKYAESVFRKAFAPKAGI